MHKIFTFSLIMLLSSLQWLSAQRGYYDAPYKRYEADLSTLSNGAVATSKSYAQVDLQSEASDQVCVTMKNTDAAAEFTLLEPADGMVIRYSVPDGETAVMGVYDGTTKITSLTLTSKWSWEYLWSNGDPNNVGVKNKNPRMRFDEVRFHLPAKLSKVKLVRESGNPTIDFIEMEPVADALTAPAGAAVFSGDGSKLQAFIDANGGKTIFVPAGVYNINSQLYFGVPQTKLQGAGMWYTQVNFTVTTASDGGLRANAAQISYADLYITTDMTTRTKGYGGIIGVYTQGSTIKNVWVEHCATGSWIGQYTTIGPAIADGFVMSDCRFRNTYADGVNLCKGTSNAIVEHCNFRNNGDDAQAVWSAEGLECVNNTFRYNTVENGWRAAGCAIYGGYSNKAHHLIIKDNLEAGLRANNFFAGIGFRAAGMHEFSNITLIGCGTYNDLWNQPIGSIDLACSNVAGTRVQNVKFSSIDILDSKNDAIYIYKNAGEGFYNLIFQNITINGTGKEYPFNNADNTSRARGYGILFSAGTLTGYGTYCNLVYSNRGGNATADVNSTAKGSFTWTALTGCEPAAVTGVSLSPSSTDVAGGATVQLVPAFTPQNASDQTVSYTSSNPAVAKVSFDGIVTGLSKGQTTITATTQDGNFTAASTVNVTSTPVYSYRIKNRWQNTYLYDAGDRVKYSATAGNNTYLWLFEDIDGVKEIKNSSTGDYMHIENLTGYVQCTTRTPGAMSSRWSLVDAGSGYVFVKSEWNPNTSIHIENLQGQAQYGAIETSWWSAMWILEPIAIVSSVSSLSLENTTELYPNPSTGDFNLSMGNFAPNEKVSITIYNLAGQAMYTSSRMADGNGILTEKVSTGNILSSGNYYVTAKGNSNFTRVKLLIGK
ncbi:MAG TPA: hypothetical protein DCL77_09990 [Prolixibacteraceae bacterium]|jgi:hypothetical protein|nr:hypothetical protein [Prolixibacteraceae bacterium]